ncbi:MAG: tyrosine-type recombinase/integrase [Flammeovirgaceae bacterium]
MNHIESFTNFLQFEKRTSAHTILAYQTDLFQFESYLNQDVPEGEFQDVVACSYRDIRSWLIHLIDTGISPRSVNRKIATLSTFFKFLMTKGVISVSPAAKLQALKTSEKLPSFVKKNELEVLLNQTNFPTGYAGQRDQLILELLYGTGIRLAELMNLRLKDIDFEKKVISVVGKGNKQRVIPLTNSLHQRLKTHLDEFPIEAAHFVIRTVNGKQAYPMLIYRTVNHYLSVGTSTDKKSPHVLRHTFATHLLENGAELNAIKDLLGHSSLAATQVYTHNSLSRLKAIFNKAHPKS